MLKPNSGHGGSTNLAGTEKDKDAGGDPTTSVAVNLISPNSNPSSIAATRYSTLDLADICRSSASVAKLISSAPEVNRRGSEIANILNRYNHLHKKHNKERDNKDDDSRATTVTRNTYSEGESKVLNNDFVGMKASAQVGDDGR